MSDLMKTLVILDEAEGVDLSLWDDISKWGTRMREIEITYKKMQTAYHGLQTINDDQKADEVADIMSTLWCSLTDEEKVRVRKHSSDLRKLSREVGILPPLPTK